MNLTYEQLFDYAYNQLIAYSGKIMKNILKKE